MNKSFYVFVAIALVVGGAVGYASHSSSDLSHAKLNFGSQIVNSGAQGSKELLTFLQGVVTDLTSVRSPLAGIQTATSSIGWGTLIGNTGANSSSSAINIAGGATIGDLCFVQTAAAASSTVNFRCEVTATGVTNATGTVYATAVGTSTSAVGTLTTRIWVLPVSSFVAPSALVSSQ